MKRWIVRILYVTAALVVCAALALPLLGWFYRWQNDRARKQWKEKALPEITRLANDRKWVAEEISRLASSEDGRQAGVIADGWLTDHMILMKSGEWLVYKSHCNKAPPHNVRDICLAKGSDGRWYYTTCHFCVGMIALMMMQDEMAQPYLPNPQQPRDLAFFIKRYHLREFDGMSDECLKETKTFPDPDPSPPPTRTYTAERKPGLPDLSSLVRAATAVVPVATESDPDLKGHGLELHAVSYERRFLRPDRPAGTVYTAIYRDDKLSGCNATGIDIEVKGDVAYFKSQKGKPLWSCALEGQPTVPDDTLVQIALGAFKSFWPEMDGNRLSVGEIGCCDPIGGNRYVVKLWLASPPGRKPSAKADRLIEMPVSTDGPVAEKEVRWDSQ